MCDRDVKIYFYRLNLGMELDLEEWRRKLDIWNRGSRTIYLPNAEIEFRKSPVVDMRIGDYWYKITRNGDIEFSFDPFHKDVRKEFNRYLEVLAEFLHNEKIDIPLDRAKLQEAGIAGSFIGCHVDLERAEMFLENEMDIEYDEKSRSLTFKLRDLKATVVLDRYGFLSAAESVGMASIAFDIVMEKVEKVGAVEFEF